MQRASFIDRIKMNEDHSLIAFTVDIGNTERMTAGVKDMSSGQILDVKIDDVSHVEFFGTQGDLYDKNGIKSFNDVLYYVCLDELGRPFKVNRMSLTNKQVQTVFVDDDPTHFVDMSISKDGKFLFISSATKEDAEVWCVSQDNLVPQLLIKREPNVRVTIQHLRDFFLIITNKDSDHFKLLTLDDKHLDKPLVERDALWQDLLEPNQVANFDGELIISDFDCFKDFIAVYVKVNNRPQIIVQDLNTKKLHSVQVNDGDIGNIQSMMNNQYEVNSFRFLFSSPFIYQ